MRSTQRHRPRSKVQLLPLPTEQVRRLSLKHHLALAALRDGQSGIDSIVILLNVLDLAILLGPGGAADGEIYRRAGAALDQCVARLEQGDACAMSSDERTALEQLVIKHDAQLAATPVYRYLEALERTARHEVGTGSAQSKFV